ncbi:MAG: glycine--tRNA ligase subunit beta [Terracidiphilus sp.]|jgi:glycyl-tRNA synthetase beta chain
MADFLLEIGLEEVPDRMIAGAELELSVRVRSLLERERLASFTGSNVWENGARVENGVPVSAGLIVDGQYAIRSYSTPRRLAVHVKQVKLKQDDFKEQIIGPSSKVAFKDGVPTAAAEAFAKKAGVTVEALLKISNAKGEYVCAYVERIGRTAAEILAAELPKEVLSIYWAKNMYWRAGKPERFVRPVRWVVALLDSAVVPMEIAGISAGNVSRGHRVLHGEKPVVIDHPKNYSKTLRAAYVAVDVAERRQSIRNALDAATRTVAGARWREGKPPLIETVEHLTEWPTVVLGNFEPEYLALPEEVLVTVMRDHQKYFAVEDASGKLAPHFLAVLNTEVNDEGRAIIRHGNARVLKARFKDARFFWDFDQKKPLADRVEGLKNVTFKKELGSYYWKTMANLAVAKELALTVKQAGVSFDESALYKAVELAKTDLTTELVKEFTELQGKIGGLYARAQKLGESVASAIYFQFRPSYALDTIPPTIEGQLLGLADRIQTITSMFDKGFEPTGSKDPFALRRAASAIVKILAESDLPLTLRDVLHAPGTESEQGIGPDDKLQPDSPVRAFLKERQRFDLQDVRGFAYDVVNAVLAAGADDVRDAIARAEALTAVRGSEDFAAISAAFKRIKNILRQAEEKGFALGSAKDVKLSAEAQQLADAAAALAPRVAGLRQERAYGEALALIATLRPVVDCFFDKVMVLDPDAAVRGAHLGLIDGVLRGFSGIADFSEIVTG